MKKLLLYLLTAGAITLTACNHNRISLLASAQLQELPSGSSLEIDNNQLIVIGDDATQVFILDFNYKPIDSLLIDTSSVKRVAKDIKPDYESSTIVDYNGSKTLVAFGSGSTNKRQHALLMPLPIRSGGNFLINDVSQIFSSIKAAGISEINIEGAATVNGQIVLSNRANLNQKVNSFIVFAEKSLADTGTLSVHTVAINLPKTKFVVGISGLTYIPAIDMLLFTASTEATSNSYDDGEIGDSYIGLIRHASAVIKDNKISVNEWINLAEENDALKGQKVESIAVEQVTTEALILHLVADNDDGTTRLFKLSMRLH